MDTSYQTQLAQLLAQQIKDNHPNATIHLTNNQTTRITIPNHDTTTTILIIIIQDYAATHLTEITDEYDIIDRDYTRIYLDDPNSIEQLHQTINDFRKNAK